MKSVEHNNEGMRKWLESEGASPEWAGLLSENLDNLTAFRKGLRGEAIPPNNVVVGDIPKKIDGETPIEVPFAMNAQGETIIHTLHRAETPKSMEPHIAYELGNSVRRDREIKESKIFGQIRA
jgi:hypothetical protein